MKEKCSILWFLSIVVICFFDQVLSQRKVPPGFLNVIQLLESVLKNKDLAAILWDAAAVTISSASIRPLMISAHGFSEGAV